MDYRIVLHIDEQKQADNIENIIKSYGINSSIEIYNDDMDMQDVDIFICQNISGTERVLKEISQKEYKTISIMLSTVNELNQVMEYVSQRLIYHFIVMPYNDGYVREILRQTIMHMEELYRSNLKSKEDVSFLRCKNDVDEVGDPVIKAFMSILEVTSKENFIHSVQVSNLAVQIAKKLKLEDEIIHNIRIAGLLHDIGKISINDSILNKPGKLDVYEAYQMQEHPVNSYLILKDLEGMEKIAEIVYQHHEKKDGSGYPRGLSGKDILLEADILCVADTYNALTSDRIYRRGLSKKEAIKVLKNDIKQYNQEVLDILFKEK